MSEYMRYRFKTKSIDDYRPLKDMKDIQCPWWCSGEGEDYAIIICYLPKSIDLSYFHTCLSRNLCNPPVYASFY